ncbi:msf1/px19 related [Holotrichia oblita]|uniref:Msf1/px19 related n=3 Tax=Holotrichia oblita TaxID=644536 RepID=A0ACB9SUT8_HOLOL|nr:msf1/px19 related [Holotrichia oblita]KAI4457937.1 msf1/px19 related [Holotrichia oblita]KAI4457947.1 msf1/px19 related [Holotrichia oblita]
MPRYYESTIIFNFTWDQVAQAFWKRYPNPNSKHVLSEDTIVRKIDSGKLFSKRLLSKTNSIPKWAERFFSGSHIYIVEESTVDPQNKVLVTYTRNLGYTKVMSITEKVIYKASDTYPGHTVAVRSAWIDSQVTGFSRAICAFGYERFKKNCSKMVGGFNYVLSTMFPLQNMITPHPSATSKLKDVAKNASELAKAKAAPIYATLHPNQS